MMAATDMDPLAETAPPRLRSTRPARLLAWGAGLVALVLGLAWVERVDIAHRLIDRQVARLKLAARYRIVEISPHREILADITVGNPAHPDLSVKTLEIDTGWNDGLPGITGLKLTGVRLRGQSSNGRLSFGSLDPVLFNSQGAFRLPDITLDLRDATASIAGDHGPIGVALNGNGNLLNGFAGAIAMVAPALHVGSCIAPATSFQGDVAIHAQTPLVTGPLRMARLSCPGSALAVSAPVVQLAMRIAPAFDGGSVHFVLATGAARLGSQGAARLAGNGDASLRNGVLAGNFGLAGNRVYGQSLRLARLGVTGHLRATAASGTLQGDGTVTGQDLALAVGAETALARVANASIGMMPAPLLATLRNGIARETASSRLSGSWIVRRSGSGLSLVLPEMHVDGARTPHWLSLSRAMLQQAPGSGRVAIAGNFTMAGTGFPQIHGEISPLGDGAGVAKLAMPTWTATGSSLAIPLLAVRWQHDGGVGFAGRAVLSGPVPGGRVAGLMVPLQGSWSANRGLLVGNHCTVLGFERITVGGLELEPGNVPGHGLTLCPGSASDAMLAVNTHGARVSLRSTGLDLAGRINGSTMHIATGAAALAWPGGLLVKDIDVATTPAPADQGSHLHLAQLTATLGAGIAGQFSGGDVTLAATPATMRSAAGDFTWANGRLTVDHAAFRVEDSATSPAFGPIAADAVTLTMADGVIVGAASLCATATDRELAQVTMTHDLGSGTGHADVTVPGLVFDKALQPKQLSPLAEGVIADAKGTLTGRGRFDWDHGHVTSSGRLATTGFDFAAAFGPVKGVAGQVVFTDLIGLVTAPDQKLAIASINPGIEVDDGILSFALQPGHVLVVNGVKWPFLDGRLALLPTRLVLGANEERRYVLRVDGLNAAKFLARMELSNLAATGTFDGTMPLVFDANGGRIEKGLLVSRPPGGTVSYVGELTYKDLSPMANYAFQALRALKYREMRISMDGALAGNIVTHVRMQGVGQAKGAKRNFITNQIARLPIRFDVTITAPFMQLVTSFRSFYDPALLADPRTLGLIDALGRPIAHPSSANLPAALPPPVIQP